MVLAQFWFSWSRHRREEKEQFEQRSEPPLHEKFYPKKSGENLEVQIIALNQEIRKVDEGRRTSVSRVYEKTEASMNKHCADSKADIERVHDRIDAVNKRLDDVPKRVIETLKDTHALK